MMGKIGYKLAPELADKTLNPEYNVTVANNIITIPAHIAMADKYGTVTMIIEIPDTTDNMAYTYSCNYIVDKNLAYTANLHTSIDNVVKLTDQQFYDKGIRSGLADAQTTAKKSDIANFLNKNLDDVNLSKLNEKIQLTDSGKEAKQNTADLLKKANIDMTNIAPATFNRELTQNKAFQDLQNKHPSTTGKTDKEIKDLFYANRYEEVSAVDLTLPPFDTPTTLLMVYQINTDGGTIKQVLPPHTTNQIIMVEMFFTTGVTSATLEIDVQDGEHLEGNVGKVNHVTFTEQGYLGYFIPLRNDAGYEFVSHHETLPFSLNLSDDRGNVVMGSKQLEFETPLYLEHDDDTNVTKLKMDNQGGLSLQFNDNGTNQDFTPSKVQSLDKSIRIANLGGVADLSVQVPLASEGIMARMGIDELYNTKYPQARLYFNDVKCKGGNYVYFNMQNKSYVIQETDDKDPNVTGGTTFLLGLYYEPNPLEKAPLSQDGYIRLEWVDDTGTPLTDLNGNPTAVQIDYKAGDMQRSELLLCEVKAKAYQEVHMRIDSNFANEEILSVGANTSLLIQPITNEQSSGLAILNFMAYTGIRIELDSKYYGLNNMNFAQFLVFPQAEVDTQITNMSLGNQTYIDFKSNCKLEIKDYAMHIKDDNNVLPIFSIYKRYNHFDTENIKLKTMKISVTLTNKQNAFNVSLLKYVGSEKDIPSPEVLSYQNTTPQFNQGWQIVDTLFIAEDIVNEDHKETKDIIIPNDTEIEQFAVVLYANESEMPLNLQLKDFEVDLTPAETRVIILNNSHIHEEVLLKQKEYYKAVVGDPKGYASYRFTASNVDTKVPVGVISGGDGKIINNHAWQDTGAIDPNQVQGDFEFKADGKVNMSYQALCYNEQGTLNQVEFWLAKVNDDGSFTEVPNSRIATTIEANRQTPKRIINPSFDFDVKQGESYRMFMKSDKVDGFYIQCDTTNIALFNASIVFDEMTVKDKEIMEQSNEVMFMEDGKEVFNKMLQYDVTTGKFTVKEKVGV